MAEKPEDLGLPHAVVNRIINDALPAHTNVSAEARRVIGKTASVFVLYVTATSANLAGKNGRKTMNSKDVMSAVEEMDFHQFIEPLQKSLDFFRETQKTKKINSSAKKNSTDEPATKKNASDQPKKNASEQPQVKKNSVKPTSPSPKSTTPAPKSTTPAPRSKKSPSTPSPPRKTTTTSTSKKSPPSSSPTSSKKSSTSSAPSKKSNSAGPSSASSSKKSSHVNASAEVISVSDSDD